MELCIAHWPVPPVLQQRACVYDKRVISMMKRKSAIGRVHACLEGSDDISGSICTPYMQTRSHLTQQETDRRVLAMLHLLHVCFSQHLYIDVCSIQCF